MKNNEYKAFVDLMAELSLNFRGFKTGKSEKDIQKLKMYFNHLKDYKFHAVKRGVDYLINTKIYPDFPIIAHIVEAIKNSKHRNRIDSKKEEL